MVVTSTRHHGRPRSRKERKRTSPPCSWSMTAQTMYLETSHADLSTYSITSLLMMVPAWLPAATCRLISSKTPFPCLRYIDQAFGLGSAVIARGDSLGCQLWAHLAVFPYGVYTHPVGDILANFHETFIEFIRKR